MHDRYRVKLRGLPSWHDASRPGLAEARKECFSVLHCVYRGKALNTSEL
jgi:hypothetical protein